ncbi:MAG: hypothetical protein KDA84_04995 [Planctomycetaceae bacterium]|nr:hypothetical protein [Planctomycetaceae bacterium]
MDEAGYGPNLGPLVVTVTVWEVPGSPHEFDFWNELAPTVVSTNNRTPTQNALIVGDSKEVYSSTRGINDLEASVLTILESLAPTSSCFQDLHRTLSGGVVELAESEPWYKEPLSLPLSAKRNVELIKEWQNICTVKNIKLRAIASDLVLIERFNRTVAAYDSKGLALSRISLGLLRQIWDPDEQEDVLVVADKHGGRNRYDELLAEVLDEQFIFRQEEGTKRSRYRVGNTGLCFQTKAESHFPVAVASMVSKYLRELAMECFNRYWQTYLPDLKPTKGYPVDARRFRNDIAEVQKKLNIPDAILWRDR